MAIVVGRTLARRTEAPQVAKKALPLYESEALRAEAISRLEADDAIDTARAADLISTRPILRAARLAPSLPLIHQPLARATLVARGQHEHGVDDRYARSCEESSMTPGGCCCCGGRSY
jgi:hypothetical protein